jgi:hypothetical protein
VDSKQILKIHKSNDDEQLVYCMVYRVNQVDAHGDAMRKEEVKNLMYSFMKQYDIKNRVDTNHDGESNGSYVVETWLVKEGDSIFTSPKDIDGWAVGIKVPNVEIWKMIKDGKINGVSFEALAKKSYSLVEVSGSVEFYGQTSKYEDHDHFFVVKLDNRGKVVAGVTSYDSGHSHQIYKGTATDEAMGHAHRFSLDSVN